MEAVVPESTALPGAVIAVQKFRDFPGEKRSLENLAAYLTRGASACTARPLLLL